MELQELRNLVGQWYYTGQIGTEDKLRLQAEFIRLTGDPGQRCQTCDNWWHDVQMGLINYLRDQNSPIMKGTGKYQFVEGTDTLRIPFQNIILTANGTETSTVKLIHNPANNALIDKILETYPELEDQIKLNPDFIEVDESEQDSGTGEGKEQTAPLTPAQKRLATMAATKVAQANSSEGDIQTDNQEPEDSTGTAEGTQQKTEGAVNQSTDTQTA